MMGHVDDFSLSPSQILHGATKVHLWDFAKQALDRFQGVAVIILAPQDLGTRHKHFVAFAPHLLDQDGNLHFRSEEHTSELQSLAYLVCRLLLEKKKK